MYKKPLNPSVIIAIILGVAMIAAAIAFIWAYSQMLKYRDDSETIVAEAVIVAKDEQLKLDQANFQEELKKPYNTFTGPADLGSISFSYPKTWSAYNVKNDKDSYQVYFYPNVMPPVGDETALALRLVIESKTYDETVKSYSAEVEKGGLTATPLTIGQTEEFAGLKGVRLDGQFGKLNGSLVAFKVRDKTFSLRTDSSSWLGDFDNIVLSSLKFIP